VKVSGRRQSKNVRDVREPKQKERYMTEMKLSEDHRRRTFNPHAADFLTDIYNNQARNNPMLTLNRMLRQPTTVPAATFRKEPK
jgi:hypothetical protein